MDILIRNIEMPKKGNLVLAITQEGEVLFGDVVFTHNLGKKVEAVAVPEHGDLIERSKVYEIFDQRKEFYKQVGDAGELTNLVNMEAEVIAMPVVLEASR